MRIAILIAALSTGMMFSNCINAQSEPRDVREFKKLIVVGQVYFLNTMRRDLCAAVAPEELQNIDPALAVFRDRYKALIDLAYNSPLFNQAKTSAVEAFHELITKERDKVRTACGGYAQFYRDAVSNEKERMGFAEWLKVLQE